MTGSESGHRESVEIQSNVAQKEDFSIAKNICTHLGLTLNKPVERDIYFSPIDAVSLWEASCLGTYLPIRPPVTPFTNNRVRLSGDASTDWRFFSGSAMFNGSIDKVSQDIEGYYSDKAVGAAVKDDFISFFDFIDIDLESPWATPFYYREIRSRFHYGRQWYKNLGGYESLSPMTHSKMVSLDIFSAEKQWPNNKVICDILVASNGYLSTFPFDKAHKNFNEDLLNNSPFKGGVGLKPKKFHVWKGDEPFFSPLEKMSTRTYNNLSYPEFSHHFLNILNDKYSALRDIDARELIGSNVNTRPESEPLFRPGSSLSHEYRIETIHYFAKSIIKLIGN